MLIQIDSPSLKPSEMTPFSETSLTLTFKELNFLIEWFLLTNPLLF